MNGLAIQADHRLFFENIWYDFSVYGLRFDLQPEIKQENGQFSLLKKSTACFNSSVNFSYLSKLDLSYEL
jgi:hypothetical protein